MPANNELTKHPRKTLDNQIGHAFAAEVWKGLARWDETADWVRQGKFGAAARQFLAARVAVHYPGGRFDHEQVRRVLDGQFIGFRRKHVEAFCRAIPTMNRIAAYAATDLRPPELDDADDLRAVISLIARHGRNGDTDQARRDHARYGVDAGLSSHAALNELVAAAS